MTDRQASCFHEAPCGVALSRRAGVDALGTMLLVFAASGVMLMVFGAARSSRLETRPFAVGAWLMSAAIVTPTGSYAHPAVALGATLTAGPVARGPVTAAAYSAAELGGAVAAFPIILLIFPSQGRRAWSTD